MKWIALSIILFMGVYTFLTLEYRKPNRAYEPYNDMKDRGQTRNLITAGYQRIPVRVDRPTNPQSIPTDAVTTDSPGGIPSSLSESLFDQPALADSYTNLSAAPHSNALMPYTLLVQSVVADQQHQISGAYLYVQNDQVYLVPEIEKLEGSLLSRRRDNLMRLIIPGGAFKPGTYQVQLSGSKSSLNWTLQVH